VLNIACGSYFCQKDFLIDKIDAVHQRLMHLMSSDTNCLFVISLQYSSVETGPNKGSLLSKVGV
jgi:hypothetical protein